MIDDINIANYAYDNTPFVSGDTTLHVKTYLENVAKKLFEWFNNNHVKTNLVMSIFTLISIQDRLFRGCSQIGGQKGPLPKFCHIYPTMMKLGTVIPYLKKIQKIYKSRDTPLEFCWHQHFSPEISKFCYIKKCRYRLHLIYNF